jgi:hypothetical protein
MSSREVVAGVLFVAAMAVVGIAREGIGWLDALTTAFCLIMLKSVFPDRPWYEALANKLKGELWILAGSTLLVCLPSTIRNGHPDVFAIMQIPLAIAFFLGVILLYELIKLKRRL